MKTRIIAEVGPNHNGDLNIAKDIVKKLKNSGVDYIKFQLAIPNDVYSDDSFFADYQKNNTNQKTIIEMSKQIQLSFKEHSALFKFCNINKLRYCCSAFDLKSLKYIYKNFNLPFFKVPSGEIFSLDTIDFMKKKDIPILLSTGTSKIEDIEFIVNYLGKNLKNRLVLMHCISSYPAKLSELNLNFMNYLSNKFNLDVGYSDHSLGPDACMVAASMGAKYIEKHVTLDKSFKGPDHKSSMEIDEFIKLVKDIKKINTIKGSIKKIISKETKNVKKVALKSCVTKKFIKKNDLLKKNHICFKRPGTGISPRDLNKYLGKRIKVSVLKNRVLKKEYF